MQLHTLLEASAEAHPGRTAVHDPEREVAITYADLDAQAETVREVLVGAGVGEGDRVGLYVPKSIGSVAGLFGAMKAGGAYVPVDPKAPASRNAFIFQDCAVRAIVMDRALVGDLEAAYGQTLHLVAALDGLLPYGVDLVVVQPPSADEALPEPPEGLAYILYTSGSTGKPKGVMHAHRTARAFIDWCSETYAPTPDDVFSSHAPFHFDLSILDLYVPIKHGAQLVLLGEDLGKQPQRLAEVIDTYGITAWYSTPSILRLLTEYGALEEHDHGSLRIVNFAGEVFPIKHLRALMDRWPHPRYFNLYGPTETNVCTYYEVPDTIDPDRTEPFPIGVPCSDDRTLVVDEDDEPVEAGEEGELLVAGGSVMLGYWNLPERNAKAFHEDADGTRWYRTGDVVREDEDGDYLFIGRRDRMVKRRGYRVELGEIQAALYRHPDVAEAAVIALPDEESGVLVKAYLHWQGEGKPSTIKLKRFCTEHLPLYMIPDRFVNHGPLPKTSTDKVDYQALKALG